MVNVEVPLTGSWQRIATQGKAFFAPSAADATWIVTQSTTAPTMTKWWPLAASVVESANLSLDEHLWVKGTGSLYLRADAPVAQ